MIAKAELMMEKFIANIDFYDPFRKDAGWITIRVAAPLADAAAPVMISLNLDHHGDILVGLFPDEIDAVLTDLKQALTNLQSEILPGLRHIATIPTNQLGSEDQWAKQQIVVTIEIQEDRVLFGLESRGVEHDEDSEKAALNLSECSQFMTALQKAKVVAESYRST